MKLRVQLMIHGQNNAKLATFINYSCYLKRLPVISSNSEIFQSSMEEILDKDLVFYFDDILIFNENEVSHERHLNCN